MSKIRQITYNLPGVGNIKASLYPYTQEVWDFLEYYEHIDRLKNVNQLGSLRYVYNGAHHNRFEYLITQLAIITELCNFDGPLDQRFSLSSNAHNIDNIGRINSLGKNPSKGEVLQVYAILSNIGHLPGTFSSERALLSKLRKDKSLKKIFKYGLNSKDYDNFEKAINSFSVYKFNIFITLFLLRRYRRKKNGNDIVDFCENVIRSYSNHETSDDPKAKQLWMLYRAIRRFVYLSLDSLYAPVPFSIDISSLILSIEQYLEEIFYHESTFQYALARIEGVMRDSVYLSPKSLLQISKASENVINKIDGISTCIIGKNDMKKVLSPSEGPLGQTEIFDGIEQLKNKYSDEKYYLSLSYKFDRSVSSNVIKNTVEKENSIRNNIGLGNCRVGIEWDPSKEYLKIAATVNAEKDGAAKRNSVFNIAKNLIKLDLDIIGKSVLAPREKWSNYEAILKFLARSTFGWDYKYHFRIKSITDKLRPYILCYGSSKSSKILERYIKELPSSLYKEDELNELHMVRRSLNKVNYRGLLIAFYDEMVITNNEKEIAEVDGIIFMLGKHEKNVSTIVIEAKNTSHGHTEAKNSIKEKFEALNINNFQLYDLVNKGAYATLNN